MEKGGAPKNEGGQQGQPPRKDPFEALRKEAERLNATQGRDSAGRASGADHIEAAKRLLYARNSAEARNVASFMRLTNYAWSGISFAIIFAFSMASLYKYFNRKPEEPVYKSAAPKKQEGKE